MSAHRILADLFRAGFETVDPGNAATFVIDRDMVTIPIVTAASETRTLGAPTKAGLQVLLSLKTDGGDCVVTVTGGYNQANSATITFGDAGDWCLLTSVCTAAATYAWRVVGGEGAGVPAAAGDLDGITAGTVAASKAVIVDSNKDISAFRNLTATTLKATGLSIGTLGAEVALTATPTQLNAVAGALAGATALVASGIGGSQSVTKTSATTTTVLAANTKARACLVVVTVDETYAVGTGTLPTVKVGEDDTIEKCMAATVLTNQAAGTTLVYAFTNLATKKVIITTTAAVGNSTGGCTVTVIAIPTT